MFIYNITYIWYNLLHSTCTQKKKPSINSTNSDQINKCFVSKT